MAFRVAMVMLGTFHINLEKSSSRVANRLVYERSVNVRAAFSLDQLGLSLVGSQK